MTWSYLCFMFFFSRNPRHPQASNRPQAASTVFRRCMNNPKYYVHVCPSSYTYHVQSIHQRHFFVLLSDFDSYIAHKENIFGGNFLYQVAGNLVFKQPRADWSRGVARHFGSHSLHSKLQFRPSHTEIRRINLAPPSSRPREDLSLWNTPYLWRI